MHLYYLRHAQSANNLLWELTADDTGRCADPELTSTGGFQVQCLSRSLADVLPLETSASPHTFLYSSLMLRALSTAAPLAQALDLPLTGWTDLHETGGIYLDDFEAGTRVGQPGSTRSFLLGRFPGLNLPDSVGEEGWWNRPYEEREERLPRARRVLEELLQRHGGTPDVVIFVSHGAFFNYFMAAILGQTEGRFANFWFDHNNAAYSRIDFRPGGEPALRYLNRTSHLPPELLT